MANDAGNMKRLLANLRRQRVATGRELGVALGLSQSSVSRAISQAGARVGRVGHARRTRYAAARGAWPELDVAFFGIDHARRRHAFEQLTAMHGGCVVHRTERTGWCFRDDFSEGLFPGLPRFLDDLQPQASWAAVCTPVGA